MRKKFDNDEPTPVQVRLLFSRFQRENERRSKNTYYSSKGGWRHRNQMYSASREMMKLLTIKEGYGFFPPVVLAPFLTISMPPKINFIV